MNKFLVCMFGIVFCFFHVNAQQTVKVEWAVQYGGTGPDWGYSIISYQNGYYIAGNISDNSGGRTAFVMKTDTNGDKVWFKTYPFDGYKSWGKKIILANNNEHLQLICRLSPLSSGSDKVGIVSLNFDGEKKSDRIFDGIGAVPCLKANTYVVATRESIARIEDNEKIMEGGLEDWGIGGKKPGAPSLSSVSPIGTSNILYATSQFDSVLAGVKYVGTYYGFRLMSTDCELRPSWTIDFKDVGSKDFISDFCYDKQYNTAFTGRKSSFASLGIIDPTGEKLAYTTVFEGTGNGIIARGENEYIIAGKSKEIYQITSTNSKGAIIWSSTPITGKSGAESVCISEDGSIISCGYVSKGQFNTDILIVKLTLSTGGKE